MPEYLTPGVYVEEIDSGSKPIEGVGTSTAAFIGYAKSGEFNKPTKIANWTQFVQIFGEEEEPLVKAICDEKGINAEQAYELRRKKNARTWTELARKEFTDFEAFLKKHNIEVTGPYIDQSYLAHSVYGYYANGGANAYIVRIARDQDIETHSYKLSKSHQASPIPQKAIGAFTARLKADAPGRGDVRINFEAGEGDGNVKVTISREGVPPETIDTVGAGKNASPLNAATMTQVRSRVVELELVEGATANLPALQEYTIETPSTGGALAGRAKHMLSVKADDFVGDEARRTGGLGGLAPVDDVNFIAFPDLMAGVFNQDGDLDLSAERRQFILDTQCALVGVCERKNDVFAILDPLPGLTPQTMLETTLGTAYNCKNGQAGIYYPWIQIADPAVRGKRMPCPPSGHIAGVFAKVAVNRGVHKAPANEPLIGAVALEYDTTKVEQGDLNLNGINCIRSFPGRGILIWGARTLAVTNNPSWKYINVRLLFNFLKRSLDRGMQWVVFEPNDQDLWGRVRRNIAAFLWIQWKEGKLFGAVPDEAFYVKCDEELNPQETRDQGRLYCEIGVNPVKPAEFVILQMGQWSGGGSIMEQ